MRVGDRSPEVQSFDQFVDGGGSPELDRVCRGQSVDPAIYELDPVINETDFRHVARMRLSTQDEEFQKRWLKLINDTDPRGRVYGYTAVWTAMIVHEAWERTKAHG
jgi:hypothetical protein